MANKRLRIAVVQISCHPAARIGGKDYISEPFVGFGTKSPLMELAKVGLPVASQRQKFRDAYRDWGRKRLAAILNRLKRGFNYHPKDLRIPRGKSCHQLVRPDVVVFPEYSIPYDQLDLIREFARETGVTVFAGTHSLEGDLSKYGCRPGSNRIAQEERVDKSTDDEKFNFFDFSAGAGEDAIDENRKFGFGRIEAYANGSIGTKSVMPVFNVFVGRENDRAKDILIPKRMLSIFEMTASGTSTDSAQFDEREEGSADEDGEVQVSAGDVNSRGRNNPNLTNESSAGQASAGLVEFHTIEVRPLKDPYWQTEENSAGVPHGAECDKRFRDCERWTVKSEYRESEPITVLPLICSEVLQFPAGRSNLEYDLAVFLAYNDKAEPFDPEIQRHSKNKIPVIFCNDGKSGGSSVTIPFDDRIDFWWTDVPNRGRLPEGDCVLVTDVDLKNIAVPVNVNKVEDRFQVLALSAVVPQNDLLSEYRVAMRLADLCDRATQKPTMGKASEGLSDKLTTEEAMRVLEECRDAESPTPLQMRKVLRLYDLKDIDRRLWDIHGQDIIFHETSDEIAHVGATAEAHDSDTASPHPVQVDSRKRTTRQLENLSGLERRQARECIDFIRTLAKSERVNADQAAVLHQALTYCQAVAEGESRGPDRKSAQHVERAAWIFFDGVRERAVQKAVRQVTAVVADLVTRFGASSAWLFRTDSEKEAVRTSFADQDSNSVQKWLRLVITHNARFEPERLPFGNEDNEQSLVGHVAQTRRGALYREIVHSYKHTIPRNFRPVRGRYTGSAMAVPIFAIDDESEDNELLGVLTLESNRTAAFMSHHLAELESEVTRLVHCLIVLRKASETVRDYRLIWNPEATSWNLTDVLNEFCFSLASSVPDPRQDPGFGCTVWHADHMNYTAFAQGAVRFDHEYLTSMLPTVDATLLDKNVIKPQSFVGFVTSHEGSPEWVWRGDWDAAPYFVRHDKAIQMGLRTIVSAPIYKTEDRSTQDAEESPAERKTAADRIASLPEGALTFYFYDDDVASRETASNQIDNLAVLRCSDILSRFLARSRRLGADIAAGLTRSRLRTEVTRLEVGFEVLRDIVMDCLDGEGCSIFLCDDSVLQATGWPKRLQCVSTTGIRTAADERVSGKARTYLPNGVVYEVRCSEAGLRTKIDRREKFAGERTLRCLLSDKSPVRDNLTNVGPAADEKKSPARHIETGLLDTFEDRRFLGVGVFISKGKDGQRPLGVIRVLRSALSRPFVSADGEVLQAIAKSAIPLFLESLHQSHEFGSNIGAAGPHDTPVSNTQPACTTVSPNDGKAKWLNDLERFESLKGKHSLMTAKEGLRRVCAMPEFNDGWTRRRVVATLRDLLVGLRWYGARSAFVSIVTENAAGSEQMSACYFESLGQDSSALPPHAEPVHSADDAIRWQAHVLRNLIQFDDTHSLFTPLTAGHCDTAAGFCLPLQLGFHGRPVDGVLAVDFSDQLKKLSPEKVNSIVYCINQAALKLVALSAGVCGASVARVVGFRGTLHWFDECRRASGVDSTSLGNEFRFVVSGLYRDASKYHRSWPSRDDASKNKQDRGLVVLNLDNDYDNEWWNSDVAMPKMKTWCREFSQRMEEKSCSLDALYSQMVDRDPRNFVSNPAVDAPIRRAFGRSPHECADNIRLLKQLGVKLDFEKSRFALPLRFGFYIIGYCVGEFDRDEIQRLARKKMLPIDLMSDSLTRPNELLASRECVNIMAQSIFDLNAAWLLRAYSVAYNEQITKDTDPGYLFGITFEHTKGATDGIPLEWPAIDERVWQGDTSEVQSSVNGINIPQPDQS